MSVNPDTAALLVALGVERDSGAVLLVFLVFLVAAGVHTFINWRKAQKRSQDKNIEDSPDDERSQ